MRTPKQQRELDNALATLRNPGGGVTLESHGFVERKPVVAPPTAPRPMTAAEARAIEALVEWRRLDAAWDAAWDAGVQESTAAVEQAENTMRDAADAVVAEREVQRGA